MKPNPASRFRPWFHHPLQHLRDDLNVAVMKLHGFRQLSDLLDQLAGRRHEPPQPNERPHDLDVYPDGPRRIKHDGKHRDALFGEDPGPFPPASATGF
jgi:hypothetical protein